MQTLTPLDGTSQLPLPLREEERSLIADYAILRVKAEAVKSEEDISLGPDGGPSNVADIPGASEIVSSWTWTYPVLSNTDAFVERIPALKEALFHVLSQVPVTHGRLTKTDVSELRNLMRPVAYAVSLFARYLHAVESLRSLVSHVTGEPDETPVDAYAIGGAIMRDPRYVPYDRLAQKLRRNSKAGREKLKEYNSKPPAKTSRAKWITKKRQDPEFRAAENAKERARYAKRRDIDQIVEEVTAFLDTPKSAVQS